MTDYHSILAARTPGRNVDALGCDAAASGTNWDFKVPVAESKEPVGGRSIHVERAKQEGRSAPRFAAGVELRKKRNDSPLRPRTSTTPPQGTSQSCVGQT